MEAAVHLRLGPAAREMMSDPDFRRRWDGLHASCPWATVFQSRAFAQTWYSVYGPVFEPLLICAFAPDGELHGLLPLARRLGSNELVHAGAHQSEYQVWIAPSAYGDRFIELALEGLAQQFPGSRLRLLFLPPDTPLGWLAPGCAWSRRAVLRAFVRPLRRVGPGSSVEESLRKKSNRSRLNRLERTGPVRFEVLRSRAELEPCFDRIIEFCDLRQGAAYQCLPFRQDPLKKEFYLRLMETPGLMHASVLRAGEEVIAAHLGARDRASVQLGLIAHSPFFAEHSPGKLLLLLLGRQLGQEGYADLDLTPGGDYKDRFADHVGRAYAADIFLRAGVAWRFRVRQLLARAAKAGLAAARTRPDAPRRWVQSLHRAFDRAKGGKILARACRRLLRFLYSSQRLRFYVMSPSLARQMPSDPRFRKDCLADLLLYEPALPGERTIAEFLRDALKRLESGSHVYTLTEGPRLVLHSWLERVSGPRPTELGSHFDYPPNSVVLWDSYTHPDDRGRGLHLASLRHRLREAAAVPGVERIFVCVLDDNGPSRHNIERAGFQYYAELRLRLRLGQRRWNWTFAS